MQLFDYELSGNCYKVRFLLHMLGVAYDRYPVDFHPGREHKAAWFTARHNPLGQIPVLVDDGVSIRDAQAILVYLASKYDTGSSWYPDDPLARARIQVWLGTADEITRTASAARLHDGFGYPVRCGSLPRRRPRGIPHAGRPPCRDAHGLGQRWLAAGDAPTIADIACFPYAALAPEGGIALDEFPALRRWIGDFRRQPRFVGMAGIMAPALSGH
jgi:glutathione S-transferase